MKKESVFQSANIFTESISSSAKIVLKHILSLIFGFSMAQAGVFKNYAPFGIAFVAASEGSCAYTAAVGAGIGYFISKPGAVPIRYIAAIIAALVLNRALSGIRAFSKHSVLAPLNAFICCAATGIALAFSQGLTFNLVLMYLAEGLLAAGSAFFINRTINITSGNKGLRSLSSQELACVVITGCLILMSFSEFTIYDISPARILTVLIILFAARYGHEAAGSIVGISAGLTMSLTGNMNHLAAAYAFGGLLGGVLAPLGQLGTAAGFIVANGFITIVQQGSGSSLTTLYEAAAASIFFVAIPSKWSRKIESYFTISPDIPLTDGLRNSVVMRLSFASRALNDVSESVEAVSEKLKRICAPDINGVYERVQDDICSKCGLRLFCWEKNYTETMNIFNDMSLTLRSFDKVTEDNIPQHFSQRCIKLIPLLESFNRNYNDYLSRETAEARVAEVRSVVADQFDGMADMLLDLSTEFEEAQVFDVETAARVTTVMNAFNIYPHDVSCILDKYGRMTVEIHCGDIKEKVPRASLTKTMREACDRIFDPPSITVVGNETLISYCERASLTVKTGAYQLSCENGALCGDAYEYFNDGRGREILMISDGMGSGGRAAVDGTMAVGLISRLVRAGFGFDCSLRIVNSALLVKSGDESLATLDIACIDLFTGNTQFLKAGAPASFVRRSGRCGRIEQSSLPAGILREVEFGRSSLNLSDGDLVLLVSDGAINGSTEWVNAELESWTGTNPKELASHIGEEAKRRRLDGHDDDITVLAAMIQKGI